MNVNTPHGPVAILTSFKENLADSSRYSYSKTMVSECGSSKQRTEYLLAPSSTLAQHPALWVGKACKTWELLTMLVTSNTLESEFSGQIPVKT
jgi:hypothetical protein